MRALDIDLRGFLRHIQHLGPRQPMRLQMRQDLGTVFGVDGHAKGFLIPLINDNVIHDPALVIAYEGVFAVPLLHFGNVVGGAALHAYRRIGPQNQNAG